MRKPAGMVLRVLLASPPDPCLKVLVTDLYAEWTVLAAREYLSLPTGAREAAFAVVLERLVREGRRGKLTEGTFVIRARALLLQTLAARAAREQRHRGTYAERCAQWLPDRLGDTATTPAELADVLWRAALGDRTDPVEAALAALWHSWHRRAARVFRSLDAGFRHDAVVHALLRVVQPITAASLTPANLSRRFRDIAVQALSDASKKDRQHKLHLTLGDSVDRIVANDGPVEDAVALGFRFRVWNEMMKAVEAFAPWMRSAFRRDTKLKNLAAQEGRPYQGFRKESSRYHLFLRKVDALLRRLQDSRDKLPEIRKGIDRLRQTLKVKAEVAAAVAEAVERVLSSELVRAILPAAALKRLERFSAPLLRRGEHRRQDADNEGGPAAGVGS